MIAAWQKDALLERVWVNRHRFVDEISHAGYVLVAVPNLSPYTDDTFVQRRYAINRSNRLYDLLMTAGVPTIPQVSWATGTDITDWIHELRCHPEIVAFSVDFQTLHLEPLWQELALGPLQTLLAGVGPGYEVVVNGVSSQRHIEDLAGLPAHFHFVTAQPFSLAVSQKAGQVATFERNCRRLGSLVHTQRNKCRLRTATPARRTV